MDANTSFEIKAEAFRIMTGYMAPGKSQSPHCYHQEDERWEAWKNWLAKYGECAVAMLTAFERIIPND